MEKQGVLLDTHAWLWLLADPGRFSSKTIKLVSNPQTNLYLSVASIWEISIKTKLGKLTLPDRVEKYIPEQMFALGVQELLIAGSHALAAGQLPNHHADPFDRLIIAQAVIEKLPILTADKIFGRYEAKLLSL